MPGDRSCYLIHLYRVILAEFYFLVECRPEEEAAPEQMVAIVETDMCAVDAIQSMIGATFGKGNLVHKDYGKNAYTFFNRATGKAIRVSGRPGAFPQPPKEARELMSRARSGMATSEQKKQFSGVMNAICEAILSAPVADLFEVKEVEAPAPLAARIFPSVACAVCGEPTMETKLRRIEGRELCPPCFQGELMGLITVSNGAN